MVGDAPAGNRTKVNLMENDKTEKQLMTAILRELWADLRSYNSNVWQIVAFTLVAIAVFVTALSEGLSASQDFMLTSTGLLVLGFLSVFLFLVQGAVWRISLESEERVRTLGQLEKKLSIRGLDISVSVSDKSVSRVVGEQTIKIASGLPWFPVQHVRMVTLLAWGLGTLVWFLCMVLSVVNGVSGLSPIIAVLGSSLIVCMIVLLLLLERASTG